MLIYTFYCKKHHGKQKKYMKDLTMIMIFSKSSRKGLTAWLKPVSYFLPLCNLQFKHVGGMNNCILVGEKPARFIFLMSCTLTTSTKHFPFSEGRK